MAEDKISILLEAVGVESTSKGIDRVSRSLDSLSKQITGATDWDKLAGNVDSASKSFSSLAKAADQLGIETVVYEPIEKSINSLEKFSNFLDKVRMNVLFLGLGIMFFGMQLKRIFEGLIKDVLSTYTKITEGQTAVGQSLTMLSAGFEYLKFVIGDAIVSAIEPFIPMILDIIEIVAEWVSNHKTLTATILLSGLALGIFLFFTGQLLTFFNSLSLLLPIVTKLLALLGINLTGLFSGGILSGLASVGSLLLAWIPVVILIVAAILILKAAWDTNFGGIRDFTMTVLGNIWSLFKGIFNSLISIVTDFSNIFTNLFSGNYKEALKWMLKLIVDIAGLLAKIGAFIINTGLEIIVLIVRIATKGLEIVSNLAMEVAKQTVLFFIDLFEKAINSVIDQANEKLGGLGVNIGKIDLSGAKQFVNTIASGIQSITTGIVGGTGDTAELGKENLLKLLGMDNLDTFNNNVDLLTKEISTKFIGLDEATTIQATAVSQNTDALTTASMSLETTSLSMGSLGDIYKSAIESSNTTIAGMTNEFKLNGIKMDTLSTSFVLNETSMKNLTTEFGTTGANLDTSLSDLTLKTDETSKAQVMASDRQVAALDGNTSANLALKEQIAKTVSSARVVNINVTGTQDSVEAMIRRIFIQYGIV